jgi:cytochrome c oxidase subunit 4
MSTDHKEPNYMAVFYTLAVLTAAEIGVIYVPIPKLAIGICLVLMALAKAVLVALYFMHLKFEKRTLGVIALTPLLICTLLIISLLPDLTGTKHETKKENAAQVEKTAEPLAELP